MIISKLATISSITVMLANLMQHNDSLIIAITLINLFIAIISIRLNSTNYIIIIRWATV